MRTEGSLLHRLYKSNLQMIEAESFSTEQITEALWLFVIQAYVQV